MSQLEYVAGLIRAKRKQYNGEPLTPGERRIERLMRSAAIKTDEDYRKLLEILATEDDEQPVRTQNEF